MENSLSSGRMRSFRYSSRLPGMFSVVRWCARKACCQSLSLYPGSPASRSVCCGKPFFQWRSLPQESGLPQRRRVKYGLSMVVRFLDNTNVSRDAQFVNAPAATAVTLSGITNSVNAVARNAALPMDCKVSGNLMAVIELVANALAPMAVTSVRPASDPGSGHSGLLQAWLPLPRKSR